MTFLSRILRRPGALSALLFLASLAMAVALAWQAVGAAASHRSAVEASLKHHATIAAWRFAREGRSWVGFGMAQASAALAQEIAPQATLPGPEMLYRLFAKKECDCVSAAFSRSVFMASSADLSHLEIRGDTLSPATRAALVEHIRATAADTLKPEGLRGWTILPPGEPQLSRPTDVVLLWKVGDRTRRLRGIYGMVVEVMQLTRPLTGALGDAQFFPPSLIAPGAADSLVRIEVAGPNHELVFQSGPATRSFIGTDTLGRYFGDLTVTAAIDPSATPALVDGGMPESRARTVGGLLFLTVLLGGGALALLRRESRLARLREDFVSGVSHELRTPLTQIRVLSELLESHGFRSDAEEERAVRAIHREALRLSNLVDNILEFTRLRRQASVPASGRVALADVARDVADAFVPLLEANDNTLLLVVEDDLFVSGERDATGRILRNLIENALKYGPRGQTIRLTVDRGGSAGMVRLMVDDQGPGIPAGERLRIWQPYYRLDRDRNAAAGGSGLGLSVVADLARGAGGRVEATDAPGGGARMVVEFPLAVAGAAEPAS